MHRTSVRPAAHNHQKQNPVAIWLGLTCGLMGPRTCAGTLPLDTWTLEAVVLFLPSRHFGRTWQTVRAKPLYQVRE